MILRSVIATALVGAVSVGLSSTAKAAPTLYFAVVNADGSLARHSDKVKSRRLDFGQYSVTFPVNVSKCAYSGTVGSSSTTPEQGGSTNMNPLGGNTKGVFVKIGSQGTLVDRGFYLIVLCP